MDRFNFSKFLFLAVSGLSALGFAFAFGLYSAYFETGVFQFVRTTHRSILSVIHELPILTGTRPKHHLQSARKDGEGVTVNKSQDAEEQLVLLSGFFNDSNELRLIHRDGTILARWPVSFSGLFPDTSHLKTPPATDWNADIDGALALTDGSVVFNFENLGTVKLNRCGGVVWTLARNTHHSVERAEGGGYWVPGRRFHPNGSESPFPPFQTPFWEDTILKVSENGKVLFEISVPKLFYDNGLEAILTSTGELFELDMMWDEEIVHLNKIIELPSTIANTFPMFKAGDLALSIRALNMVLVIDPSTSMIKWWQAGPWLRQHDPEFKTGGKLVLFNNNTYATAFGANNADLITPISTPRVSNILEFDFNSGRSKIIYGGRMNQQLLSIVRGKVDLTSNGGLLITEFEAGRVIEVDTDGQVIWEYINRYNRDEVAEITEARLYPARYFNVLDWTCNQPGQ